MEIWRLLPFEAHHASLNMAIDEAILKAVSNEDLPNTIRFYRWKPSAVSIGYFQNISDEVDIEACQRSNVDVVRRITGGGAVYHDFKGEITYSVIVREENPKISGDILQSYITICDGIVKGLGRLGVKAEFKPINDIIVHGRKISGNAQTRRLGCVLQHGTILVDLNIEKMFTFLKVSGAKISDKILKRVEDRVTSLKKEVKRSLAMENVYESLVYGFQDALDAKFSPGKLTSLENEEALQIAKLKYENPKWRNLR